MKKLKNKIVILPDTDQIIQQMAEKFHSTYIEIISSFSYCTFGGILEVITNKMLYYIVKTKNGTTTLVNTTQNSNRTVSLEKWFNLWALESWKSHVVKASGRLVRAPSTLPPTSGKYS